MSSRILLPVALLFSSSCFLIVESGGRVSPDQLAPSAREASAPRGAAPLDRALATVDPEELEADLTFVAADQLGGRDTPSPGLEIAARFLRMRLERIGWTPGASDGFFWTYELVRKGLDETASRAEARANGQSVELAAGTDYFFYPRPMVDQSVEGPVAFAGSLSKGDSEGLDLDGKWAFCHSSKKVGFRTRRKRAQQAGAIGLIVVPDPEAEEETSFAESVGGYMKRGGGLTSGEGSESTFPMIYIEGEAAQRVLALASSTELQLGTDLGIDFTESRSYTVEETVALENVCALWPGSDPELRNEVILLSAHYDHVGTNSDGEIHNGADDNGSGTVGLLAVAEALTQYGPMQRSVMLLWVSGEEKGLLGSAAWAKDPWLPEGMRPVANINLDMIGRNASDQLLVTPTADHDAHGGLTELVEKFAPTEGFTDLGSADRYFNSSDQASFYRNLEIPVVFLFSDVHEDYHRPGDTADKVDYDKISRVVRLVLRLLDDLQEDELTL